MTHVHDTHAHGSTTVVESDREGPATAMMVLIVLAALVLMIWFFAFSGIVIDRDSGNTGPTINNEQQDNNYNPPGDTGNVPEQPAGTGG